jgi:hypothetical protein
VAALGQWEPTDELVPEEEPPDLRGEQTIAVLSGSRVHLRVIRTRPHA